MFINIMRGVYLSDEEFAEEMATRREVLNLMPGETAVGCPLCGDVEVPDLAEGQQQ